MQTSDRISKGSWYDTPFGRLATASQVPGCRRPSIAEALTELRTR